MSEKIPTFVVQVGPASLSMRSSAALHYAGMGKGRPVATDHSTGEIAVHSTCCGVRMGTVQDGQVAKIIAYMNNGIKFESSVHEGAAVQWGMSDIRLLTPMYVRMVPMNLPPAKKDVETKKELPASLTDALKVKELTDA